MTTPVDDAPTLRLAELIPSPAIAEVRTIDGRTAVWVEFEAGDDAVRLSSDDSTAIETAARAALDQRLPLVIVISTAGVDIIEGVSALHSWGRVTAAVAACSGVVPTFAIVDGPAVSGPALLLGVVDFTIMTESSSAFVNGPVMVEQFTGISIDVEELGGAPNHARHSGVPSVVVGDRADAEDAVAELLAYLPGSVDEEPPRWPNDDPAERPCPEAGDQMPASSTGSYDVREITAAIVDDGVVLELRARWAANLVTAFATIDGRPVGIVANQPISLAGTLDIPASQKAARFVAFCDAFNVPIITLVDTPGFYPGKDLEWRGMIRHGAQLVFAYARATVPIAPRFPVAATRL